MRPSITNALLVATTAALAMIAILFGIDRRMPARHTTEQPTTPAPADADALFTQMTSTRWCNDARNSGLAFEITPTGAEVVGLWPDGTRSPWRITIRSQEVLELGNTLLVQLEMHQYGLASVVYRARQQSLEWNDIDSDDLVTGSFHPCPER